MIALEAIDRADVLREVRAAFEHYERALLAHDVATLNAYFLECAHTVRYGVAEQQYGHAAIAAWRAQTPPVHPGRTLAPAVVTSLGADVACVSVEFREPTIAGVGRQTQTWVRTSAGWRIANAHVSVNPLAR